MLGSLLGALDRIRVYPRRRRNLIPMTGFAATAAHVISVVPDPQPLTGAAVIIGSVLMASAAIIMYDTAEGP